MKVTLEIGEVYDAVRTALEKKSKMKINEDNCCFNIEDEHGNDVEFGDIEFEATV